MVFEVKLSEMLKKVRRNVISVYIKPTFKYGCFVWDPVANGLIEQLKKRQNRARFVLNNYKPHPGVTNMKKSSTATFNV